ncbi:double-stranded RNA-specific adenosine deaminase-like isoform X2 [Physella acuta]|uniref:double-stranded RNA-specific adenosine deaminase-like isoform X2 n=1 Tax=Physella acuta TaxID=109671 RepID=UPI0027DBA97C|nr:double-stranded RNA-specific adenosine deaminase-like isoform X2 [Physella acuta]
MPHPFVNHENIPENMDSIERFAGMSQHANGNGLKLVSKSGSYHSNVIQFGQSLEMLTEFQNIRDRNHNSTSGENGVNESEGSLDWNDSNKLLAFVPNQKDKLSYRLHDHTGLQTVEINPNDYVFDVQELDQLGQLAESFSHPKAKFEEKLKQQLDGRSVGVNTAVDSDYSSVVSTNLEIEDINTLFDLDLDLNKIDQHDEDRKNKKSSSGQHLLAIVAAESPNTNKKTYAQSVAESFAIKDDVGVDGSKSEDSQLDLENLDQDLENLDLNEDSCNENYSNLCENTSKETSQDENGEQKKFSKSYWRKQRRLRLKERLLAEKMLMESNPDLVTEKEESQKPTKGVKSKEIDYDSYLPAHVLMHVKRDLVSVLMEYGQTREVKVSFKDMERSGPHHASRFHTAAVVDGETFPTGSGSSKKNAKKAAAAQALKIMYDRGRKNLEVVNEMAHKKLRAMSDEEVGSHAHRVVLVSRHVLDTAEETQFINYSKDKIAAAFVLEYHGKMRVVGLGTGNRCILYQHMTLDGKRIIHSHAEIIARRAFLRYLYKQLQTYNGNRSHPIFTRSDTGKLKIRDKIQVHLYISRPPCGDAAAFPTISNFPNKMRAIRKQGQLRTIIDDGEGAIPTDFPVPAGANGKERLRIMTCSDKICRWNVLGVQGALLSHFLDPIYINSLVIGSHTGDQRGHVPRAVSGRLKCGRLHEVIQRPYRINTPDIHYPHDDLADNYNITKSKQYCITWSYGDIDAEVIDAITGVTNMEAMEEVIPSRVSKITLYQLFQQVCKRYGRHDLANLEYLKAKRSATTFQRMKSFVGQHLAAMGFGQWYSLQETYGTDSLKCPGPC